MCPGTPEGLGTLAGLLGSDVFCRTRRPGLRGDGSESMQYMCGFANVMETEIGTAAATLQNENPKRNILRFESGKSVCNPYNRREDES